MGLIERAALLLGEPGYGLKLGISHGVRDSGLVGFIALNSPTLGDALANVERYISVTNEGLDVVFESLGSGGGKLRFREVDPPMRGLRHHAEQSMALLVKGAYELTKRRATPLCVEFTHERPSARIDYKGILGCPVRFRAEWDAVIYSEESLRLPVLDADNKLLRVLQAACRRIVGRPRKDDLVDLVKEFVVARLDKGALSFDDVARHFNMATKTLERRLGERNVSYRDLLDVIRCDLAKHYLENTDLRLAQIACAGLFRAGAAGAGVQAVDRPDAHAIPPQASVMVGSH